MTINFYLERNKKIKNNVKTIWCYIRGLSHGKNIYLNTNEKIDPKYWDKVKQRAVSKGKNKYNGHLDLNTFLDSFEEEVKRIIRNIRSDNPFIDPDIIENKILEKFGKIKTTNLSFYEALDKFLIVRKNDLAKGSLQKFLTLKKHLTDFENNCNYKVNFFNINFSFYDEFRSFLLNDKKMINNSTYKMIGILKNFLNWAYERGYNTRADFRKFKIKEDSVDHFALDKNDLEILRKMDFSTNSRLDKARDVFLFGCYTGGRFSDLANIEKSDIKNNIWYLRTKKTREIIEIPLSNFAIEILNKYSNDGKPLPQISNQKLNVYIKEIAKLAEFDDLKKITKYRGTTEISSIFPKFELITVHTARRTFVTQSLLQGMKTEIVMKICGHKNFRTFKKYLQITENEVQKDLEKAWNN